MAASHRSRRHAIDGYKNQAARSGCKVSSPFNAQTITMIFLVLLFSLMLLTKSTTAISVERELRARDLALFTLSEGVRQDLARRDPNEYDLDITPFLYERQTKEKRTTKLIRRDDGVITNCVSADSIAMTYDDGPYKWEETLTNEYVAAGMNISFFVNVQNWACSYDSPYAEYLQYAVANGSTVGSHSATHPDFQTLTLAQIDEQIKLVEDFTWTTQGLVPRLFRPPYGSTNDTINEYLSTRWGLTIVTWATDAGDADGVTADESTTRIEATTGGEIVLNHETHQSSVDQVAPAVIKDLQSKNRKSVSLAECLGVNPYKARLSSGTPKRDSTWNCDGVPAPGKSSV